MTGKSKKNVDPITELTCGICGKGEAVGVIMAPHFPIPSWLVQPVCRKCKTRIGEGTIDETNKAFAEDSLASLKNLKNKPVDATVASTVEAAKSK